MIPSCHRTDQRGAPLPSSPSSTIHPVVVEQSPCTQSLQLFLDIYLKIIIIIPQCTTRAILLWFLSLCIEFNIPIQRANHLGRRRRRRRRSSKKSTSFAQVTAVRARAIQAVAVAAAAAAAKVQEVRKKHTIDQSSQPFEQEFESQQIVRNNLRKVNWVSIWCRNVTPQPLSPHGR